ncbi:MAG: 4,5-DOPA dioxygenase extradiol [Flavobacteriales bacterium]
MERRKFTSLLTLSAIAMQIGDLKSLEKWSQTLKGTKLTPALFVGHGSPMNAIEENQFVAGFRTTAQKLPEIQAILVISAHWLTNGTAVTAMEKPKTIHDFGGFPAELFAQQYPAPGSPKLAQEIKALIPNTPIHLDHDWGLDHGTWTILKHFYPQANIPVVQFSIDYRQPLSYHFELAQQLRSLREKGVLIIGSGNIVHNLGAVDFSKINEVGYGYEWAHEARKFVNDCIIKEDYQALQNLKSAPKALQLAIPTPDHYIPLLYILGLKNGAEKVQLFNDELLAGSLSMTSLQIG